MFILHYANGETLTEKNDLWDKLPEEITSMELTLPFTPKMKTPEGKVVTLPARTISISNFDSYFFSKEAVSNVMAGGEMQAVIGQTAEIMGGIKEKEDLAVEIRVDRNGNVKVSYYTKAEIKKKYAPHAFKLGVEAN